MKFANLKNKIGMNLISYVGWLTIPMYFDMVSTAKFFGAIGFLLLQKLAIIIPLITLSFITYIIEETLNHRIKNKFILENKLYNLFFIIGLLISVFVFIFFMFLFITFVFMK